MDKLQIVKLINMFFHILTMICIIDLYFQKSYDTLLICAVLQSVALIISDLTLLKN